MVDPFYPTAFRPSSIARTTLGRLCGSRALGLLRIFFKAVTGPVTLRRSNRSYRIRERGPGRRAPEPSGIRVDARTERHPDGCRGREKMRGESNP